MPDDGNPDDPLFRGADRQSVRQSRSNARVPGGMQGLFEYMQNNVNYPKEAKNQKIEGRVIVSFIVEKDGSISDVHPLTAVHPLLDKEAMRLVNEMPRWKPGTEKGKAVRVSFALPVSFKL